MQNYEIKIMPHETSYRLEINIDGQLAYYGSFIHPSAAAKFAEDFLIEEMKKEIIENV